MRLIVEQQQGLIKALEKYGYTQEKHHFHEFHGETYMYPSLAVDCQRYKPIRVHTEVDHIEILHGNCTPWANGNEHDIAFLKELIPIIGRLDAHAELDEGNKDYGARLRIYL